MSNTKQTILNESIIQLFEVAVKNGLTYKLATKKQGIAYPTFMTWMARGREAREKDSDLLTNTDTICLELLNRIEKAHAEFVEENLKAIKEIAKGNDTEEIEKIIYDSNGVIVSREITKKKAKQSFPAMAWLIERREKSYQLNRKPKEKAKQGKTIDDLLEAMNNSLIPHKKEND